MATATPTRSGTPTLLVRGLLIAATLMLIATAIASVGYFRQSAGPASPDLFGNDYLSFYAAGKLALSGDPRAAYDRDAHVHEQQAVAAAAKGGGVVADTYYFAYPPTYLVLMAAVSALPYYASLAAFLAATALLYVLALWRIWPGWRTVLCGLAAPAASICLGFGQNGFLTAGLVALALVLLDRRPWLAGIALGLLAMKPQLGLAFPVVLVATLRWRVVLSALATVAVSAAVSLLLFGAGTWRAFFAISDASRSGLLESNGVGFDKIQSLFAVLRLYGIPMAAAYAAQLALLLAIAFVLVVLWRSAADYRLKAAAAAVGTVLMTPFVLSYDLVVEVAAIVWFASYARDRGFRTGELGLLAAVALSPELAATGVLGSPPYGLAGMAALFVLVVFRARADAAPVLAASRSPALDPHRAAG